MHWFYIFLKKLIDADKKKSVCVICVLCIFNYLHKLSPFQWQITSNSLSATYCKVKWKAMTKEKHTYKLYKTEVKNWNGKTVTPKNKKPPIGSRGSLRWPYHSRIVSGILMAGVHPGISPKRAGSGPLCTRCAASWL